MTIAQYGTFEVENYGDRLFPIIVEKELALRNPDMKLKLFSPLADHGLGVSSILDRTEEKINAILIGGGDIISFSTAIAAIYNSDWKGGYSAHSACFALPGIHRRSGVPLFWNAPGIPSDFTEDQSWLIKLLADEADYLSVRDEISRKRLENAGVTKKIHVVPDTVLSLPKHFPKGDLALLAEKVFSTFDVQLGEPIVVQLHPYYIQDHVAEMAEMLSQVKQLTNCPILLLPIGRCHNDHVVLGQIEQAGKGQFHLISKYLETMEVAAVIAHAKAFIGTSLHGAITSFAYGVPFLTYSCANLSKLEGFLDLVDSKKRLCMNGEEIVKKITLLNETPNRESYRKVTMAIDHHFDQMMEKMKIPSNYVEDVKKREMLGKYLEILHRNDGLTQILKSERHAKEVETAHLMKVIASLSIKRRIRKWFGFENN